MSDQDNTIINSHSTDTRKEFDNTDFSSFGLPNDLQTESEPGAEQPQSSVESETAKPLDPNNPLGDLNNVLGSFSPPLPGEVETSQQQTSVDTQLQPQTGNDNQASVEDLVEQMQPNDTFIDNVFSSIDQYEEEKHTAPPLDPPLPVTPGDAAWAGFHPAAMANNEQDELLKGEIQKMFEDGQAPPLPLPDGSPLAPISPESVLMQPDEQITPDQFAPAVQPIASALDAAPLVPAQGTGQQETFQTPLSGVQPVGSTFDLAGNAPETPVAPTTQTNAAQPIGLSFDPFEGAMEAGDTPDSSSSPETSIASALDSIVSAPAKENVALAQAAGSGPIGSALDPTPSMPMQSEIPAPQTAMPQPVASTVDPTPSSHQPHVAPDTSPEAGASGTLASDPFAILSEAHQAPQTQPAPVQPVPAPPAPTPASAQPIAPMPQANAAPVIPASASDPVSAAAAAMPSAPETNAASITPPMPAAPATPPILNPMANLPDGSNAHSAIPAFDPMAVKPDMSAPQPITPASDPFGAMSNQAASNNEELETSAARVDEKPAPVPAPPPPTPLEPVPLSPTPDQDQYTNDLMEEDARLDEAASDETKDDAPVQSEQALEEDEDEETAATQKKRFALPKLNISKDQLIMVTAIGLVLGGSVWIGTKILFPAPQIIEMPIATLPATTSSFPTQLPPSPQISIEPTAAVAPQNGTPVTNEAPFIVNAPQEGSAFDLGAPVLSPEPALSQNKLMAPEQLALPDAQEPSMAVPAIIGLPVEQEQIAVTMPDEPEESSFALPVPQDMESTQEDTKEASKIEKLEAQIGSLREMLQSVTHTQPEPVTQAPASPAIPAPVVQAPVTQMPVAPSPTERSVERQKPAQEPENSEPPLAPVAFYDFSLVGLQGDVAWIKTPGGTLEVKVGDTIEAITIVDPTDPEGKKKLTEDPGKVLAIRNYLNNWIVVTSNGLIVRN